MWGPRVHGQTELQTRVAGQLHILFPLGVAGKIHFTRPGEARSRGTALGLAAHRKPFEQFAVETYIQLLRPTHAFQIRLILPLQLDADAVFAVDGESCREWPCRRASQAADLSLCRSFCKTCSGISNASIAGFPGGSPVARRVTCRATDM